VLVLGVALVAFAPPVYAVGNVVISQIYGGGGGGGAIYKNDYIEIFNRSPNPVDISNWSVQYAAATGTSWDHTNIPTSTILLPGQYYLIAEQAGTAGQDLPPGCARFTGTIALSATAGKVALCNNSTVLSGSGCPFAASVVDFVGYGTTANCWETSPTAAPSATTAVIRKGAGFQDTDNNSQDFNLQEPVPCTLPVPVWQSTWGRVKQIYR
jgi:predicted extracellular nuclease